VSGLLTDKVVIITGAAAGIGLASARRFVAEGARVVLSDIDSDAGERVSAELGTSAAFVRADVTDEASIAALVAEAVRRFGRLDVMFNNAAAVGDRSPLVELSSDGIDAALALVTRSVMLGHKHAARQFVAQGSGGAVISTASSASLQGGWGAAAYTAAKHGVVGVVRHAAAELGPLGIRSNAVAPGVILTTLQARSYGVPVHRSDEYTAHLAQRLGPRQPNGQVRRAGRRRLRRRLPRQRPVLLRQRCRDPGRRRSDDRHAEHVPGRRSTGHCRVPERRAPGSGVAGELCSAALPLRAGSSSLTRRHGLPYVMHIT
jgi:NAD(P)-dependent dehydrogenase (short-subunit alcohol dehydrogenase family)